MGVRVEVTYDMSKVLGAERFEVDGARSVADVVRLARERFSGRDADFDQLTGRAAVAVNGVLVNHRRGMKTAVVDGDVVAFVKAAAGG